MKRLPLIAVIVIIVAIAAVMVGVRSLRRQRESAKPTPPTQLSAAERTQRMIDERMADPVYSNGLVKLQVRQSDLARQRNALRKEAELWRDGFVVSNEEARAVFEKLQALERDGMEPTNAAIASLVARLDELMAADPEGKRLLERRDEIEEAIKEHQGVIHDFIGAYARKQRAEHLEEGAAIAKEYRRKLIEEGKVKPYTPRPAPTNMPPPRKAGWWTNQPPAAAGSPGLKVEKSESLEGPGTKNQEPGTKNQEPGTGN